MRDLQDIRAIIRVPDADLAPPPELFLHRSTLHGQAHVARVLVHALRLVQATGFLEETAPLWASVYLHDLARTHDGVSRRHGRDAWERLATLPAVEALFARGGVPAAALPAIGYAVTMHSAAEPDPADPAYRLAALLKDADALDRVRLGDLDPRFLRHEEAKGMAGFAQRLFDRTDGVLEPGPGLFAGLWREVGLLLAGAP